MLTRRAFVINGIKALAGVVAVGTAIAPVVAKEDKAIKSEPAEKRAWTLHEYNLWAKKMWAISSSREL